MLSLNQSGAKGDYVECDCSHSGVFLVNKLIRTIVLGQQKLPYREDFSYVIASWCRQVMLAVTASVIDSTNNAPSLPPPKPKEHIPDSYISLFLILALYNLFFFCRPVIFFNSQNLLHAWHKDGVLLALMSNYLKWEKSLNYRPINNISLDVTTHMWSHSSSMKIFHRITWIHKDAYTIYFGRRGSRLPVERHCDLCLTTIKTLLYVSSPDIF